MEKILKILLVAILYVVIIFFQLVFVNNYSIFDCTLNLFITLIVITLIHFNVNYTMIFSLVIGVFLDIIYITNGFGFYTFSYMLIGLVISLISMNNFKKGYQASLFLLFIATFVFELLGYGRLLITNSVDLGLTRLGFGTVLCYILNIAPCIALYFVIEKIKVGRNKINSIYFK